MCPKTEARLIKLGTLQARIRAYNEAKATCDKDDVRVTIPRDQLLGDFEDLLEAVEQLAHELRCSNETIDMLYEKSRRYVEQVDKYEAEAKRLQEIVEVYDDRFATLNDEKNKEIAWYKERSLEFDEFALAIGYAERPEGQSGVHRMSGPQLVEVWEAREKEIDELRAEKEFVEREYAEANTGDLTRDALALAVGALKQQVGDLKLQLEDRADSEYHLRETLKEVNAENLRLKSDLKEVRNAYEYYRKHAASILNNTAEPEET